MSWLRISRTIENSGGRGKDVSSPEPGRKGRKSYLRSPQGLVDPALPTLARCAELVQNIAVDTQGDLLLRTLRFRPPGAAAQLGCDQFRTNLIGGAHPTELRIREWRIVGIIAIRWGILGPLEKAPCPLPRLDAQARDFLQLLRGQFLNSLRHTSVALSDWPCGG